MTLKTLTVTFTYDHTSGVFDGVINSVGQPTHFKCIAAEPQPIDCPRCGETVKPLSPFPVKLRMELHALARRQVDLAKQLHQERQRTLQSPTLTEAEFSQMLDKYLAAGGIVQRAGVSRRQPKLNITLKDLGLD